MVQLLLMFRESWKRKSLLEVSYFELWSLAKHDVSSGYPPFEITNDGDRDSMETTSYYFYFISRLP